MSISNRKVFLIDAFSAKVSGAQKVTHSVAEILKNDGFDVIVACRKGTNPVKTNYEQSGFYILDIPFETLLIKFFGHGDFDGRGILSKLVFIIKMSMILLAINIWVLYKSLKLNCKYIYTYDPRGFSLGALGALLGRKKFIWHLHGELKINLFKNLFLNAFCDTIICPSFYVGNKFIKKNKVHVIYNGFKPKEHKSTSVDKLPNELNVLFVGALTPQKGVHFLLSVIERIKNNHFSNVKLKIIGDSIGSNWYKPYLHKIIIEAGLCVDFVGWVDDVSEYYQWADVVAFTSLKYGVINYEGEVKRFRSSEALPTVPIESISFGCPVVSTNIAGIPEIIKNGISGYIVEEDIFQFSEALVDAALININENDIVDHNNKFSNFQMRQRLINVFA